MTTNISIYKGKRVNAVVVYIPITYFKGVNKIVVNKTSEGIKIREATIMDNKTFTLKKNNTITLTCKDFEEAEDLIGKYDVEKEGDYLKLIKV